MTDIVITPDVISDIDPGTDNAVSRTDIYREMGVQRVNKTYAEMLSHADAAKREGRLAVSCAIRLGRELSIIKMHCKHGDWERLFSGAGNRVKDAEAANVNHGLHFDFSHQTARKYMSSWQSIEAELSNEEQCKLAMAIQETPDNKPLPPSLLGKAGQAETVTQMYLSLGIISKPPAPAKPQHETILTNRNTQGRPSQKDVPAEVAAAQAIAAVRPEDEVRQRREAMAHKDSFHIYELLDAFEMEGLADCLPDADRQFFCDALRRFAGKFSK